MPEGGAGSHHRIQSLDNVKLYRPAHWGSNITDLRGPCIVFQTPNAIVHESGTSTPHGTVFIDTPMVVLCRYQLNLTVNERAERARD